MTRARTSTPAGIFTRALGVSVPLATATIIEALGSGVRFATFLVPASVGAAAGLAFSFVRRARQVVWIVIGLAVLVLMRRSDAQAA